MSPTVHNFYFECLLIGLALVVLALYLNGAWREHKRGRRWPIRYSVCFTIGVTTLVAGLWPAIAAAAHADLRVHMLQHILLGMLAPLGLVLAAPVTLMLRRLSASHARRLISVLNIRPLAWACHPAGALLLNVGGMYLLYLTPLYQLSLASTWLHGWVHVHFIIAGCIFTWAIAGPDPGPVRTDANLRLVFLFAAVGLHAVLAKVMYAYGWPRGAGHSLSEIREAAKIMYYGGDLAELLLIIAFFVPTFSLSHRFTRRQRLTTRLERA